MNFSREDDNRFSKTLQGTPLIEVYAASLCNRDAPSSVLGVIPYAENYVYEDNNTSSALYETQARVFPAIAFSAEIKSTASYFFTEFYFGPNNWAGIN